MHIRIIICLYIYFEIRLQRFCENLPSRRKSNQMTKNGCELEWYLKPSINFNGFAKFLRIFQIRSQLPSFPDGHWRWERTGGHVSSFPDAGGVNASWRGGFRDNARNANLHYSECASTLYRTKRIDQ